MTQPETRYGLGRIPSPPDARDREFAMRALLPQVITRKYRYWRTGRVLNQGGTPHCVGFAWAQWQQTSPVRPNSASWTYDAEGHVIYQACKQVDGYAGDGTWVRVGADVMRNAGRLATYVWAWNAGTVRDWILEYGPVVVGTNWYQQMYYPGRNKGWLEPQGDIDGGHAWTIVGFSQFTPRGPAFRMVNSWGTTWGQSGRAWITFSNLERLISEDGEAVTAAELAR